MATVDRVLPWRRNERPPADEVAPLLAAYRARHPKANTGLIARAYWQFHRRTLVSHGRRASFVAWACATHW